MKYSLILPCRNEAPHIGRFIEDAHRTFKKMHCTYEIIVVDNNSTDDSAQIARQKQAQVIVEQTQGYGAAYRKGFKHAKGEYIIMCDPDGSYDITELPLLIKSKGDFVLGNRFNNKMQKKAMPWMRQHIGNPLLNTLLNIRHHIAIKDSHSGFRVINRKKLQLLQLQSPGMELATEMIIKAHRQELQITEINIKYHPRIGESKLRNIRDGWRHTWMIMKGTS